MDGFVAVIQGLDAAGFEDIHHVLCDCLPLALWTFPRCWRVLRPWRLQDLSDGSGQSLEALREAKSDEEQGADFMVAGFDLLISSESCVRKPRAAW